MTRAVLDFHHSSWNVGHKLGFLVQSKTPGQDRTERVAEMSPNLRILSVPAVSTPILMSAVREKAQFSAQYGSSQRRRSPLSTYTVVDVDITEVRRMD